MYCIQYCTQAQFHCFESAVSELPAFISGSTDDVVGQSDNQFLEILSERNVYFLFVKNEKSKNMYFMKDKKYYFVSARKTLSFSPNSYILYPIALMTSS